MTIPGGVDLAGAGAPCDADASEPLASHGNNESFIRARNSELSRRVRMLEAERRRLERLLALALRVATNDGRDCDPLTLLEVLAAIDGDDLTTPAWVLHERDRRARFESRLSLEELARLLRPTTAERVGEERRAA